MIIKKATQVGNKIIRTKSKPVANPKGKTIKRIIKDLIDSMRHHQLVGMAAPQIGKNVRIFVTEIRSTKLRKRKNPKDIDLLRIFINPKLLTVSRKKGTDWEGCGSVASANLFGLVKRPVSLEIEAQNEKGEKFKLKATKLLARVIQHEVDHLNGVVFTDKGEPRTYMSREEYLIMRKTSR